MKTRVWNLKVGALALAIEGMLVAMGAMPARADDEQEAALTQPTSFVDVGAIGVSRDSAKFGEYTGLNRSGGYLNGNFGLRGGDGYRDGTTRWSLTGIDVGLTSRSLSAMVSDQGRWNLGLSYDELRHYTSDSYLTPYLGDMGGNRFVLPAGFGLVGAAAPGTRALNAAQLGAFHQLEINNTRQNTLLTAGLNLNRQWDFKVDYNHLDQTGAKLMAFGSAAFGGANGQIVSILPMPSDSKTDTITAALSWTGDKAHATGSYFGSFYRNNNNGVQFQTFVGASTIQTMGTAPDNDFHQWNLTGGYALSERTKLAGGLSYGRNTQNTPYSYDTAPMVTASPTTSLNGSVQTVHADLKLTDQTTRNLILSAGFKYDDRDNRTASNIYNSRAIDGGNIYNYPNTPLSIKRTGLELAGDYRLDPRQKIRLAYNGDGIDRKCNQYASGGGTPAYAPGTNCVTAISTRDDRLGATYRLKANDAVNLNVGYTYSNRITNFDENARAAFISRDGDVGGSSGTGVITGINAGDYRGFHPYFEASRKQDLFKAGASWQASDKLSFSTSGRYANDDYRQTLGATRGTQSSLNLDATYIYSDSGSVFVYVTQQDKSRNVSDQQVSRAASATALAVPVDGTWTNKLKDHDVSLGVGFKQSRLLGGKFELIGDLTYSQGRTRYDTVLNYNTTTTGGLTCADPTILTCGELSEIRTAMTQLALNGIYQLDKKSKVSVGYIYRHLSSEDFYYNGLQNGFTPTGLLPTNQTAPGYSVSMGWVSYIYSF